MNDQMLHVHVIDELRTGGAQTHLITMLRETTAYPNIKHHVVCLFGDGELSEEIRGLGIQVHILDLRPLLRKRRFLAAAREVRTLLETLGPDLVEAHLTWSRFIALLAAWQARVPLRIGFEQGDLYMNSWKFRIANFAAQWLAHRIVVCSEALGDWTHHTHGILRSKLLVLHNCVDLAKFNPDGPVAADIRPAAGATLFCAVGTLGRGVNKRMDICIRALAGARAQGANVALIICGDGEQRSELETLASSLGVASQVRFLGTRSDVPAILRACDVFCHAAPWEPFGIVAIEAMAVGLPIVVPNAGGIKEILNAGEAGLLYPALDDHGLSRVMVMLALNPGLRKSMKAAARRIVEDRFSVQRYLTVLYRAYGIDVARVAAMAGAAS
jgi:glycosyltransferase involved in cell wall biosynthesis